MIIKILYSKAANRIYVSSKPSHNGRDRQHAVSYDQEPSVEMLKLLQGKSVGYFHAHMKEDSLVIDDEIEGQRW